MITDLVTLGESFDELFRRLTDLLSRELMRAVDNDMRHYRLRWARICPARSGPERSGGRGSVVWTIGVPDRD